MGLEVRSTSCENTCSLPPRLLLKFAAENVLPRLQRFGGPDPHAASDAHHQQHENLNHKDLHSWDGALHHALLAALTVLSTLLLSC